MLTKRWYKPKRGGGKNRAEKDTPWEIRENKKQEGREEYRKKKKEDLKENREEGK